MSLFRKIYTVLKPGGTFIIELQDWASYAEAKKQSDVRWSCICLENADGTLGIARELQDYPYSTI